MSKEEFLKRLREIEKQVEKSKCHSIEAQPCTDCEKIIKKFNKLILECN